MVVFTRGLPGQLQWQRLWRDPTSPVNSLSSTIKTRSQNILCFFGTGRVVCGARSMLIRPTSVRPSVCPSAHSAAARRCCGFAAVGSAATIYRSIAARPVGRRSAAAAPQHDEQQQMRAVPRCQLTSEAERRLVYNAKMTRVRHFFYFLFFLFSTFYLLVPSGRLS